MNLSFIEIKCLYSLKRYSHKTTHDFNTMYRRFLYESDNKAKSVTGISLEAPKYSCIETKQDGVKVILEFPEFDETRERTEAGYHQLEIQKEVNNVLSHTLREQIKNHQIYHVERIS